MAVAGKIMHELKYEIGSSKLREMAADGDVKTRKQAAEVLSTIHDEFAEKQMERLAEDSDPEISAWTKLNLYCSPQCFGHESVPSGVFVVW